MAQINFIGGGGAFTISNLSGSGIIFAGAGQGQSVAVGSYQDTSWIGSADGTSYAQQINNNKYMNAMSGILNSASSGVQIRCFPNYLATLNISFTHTSAVKTQNAKLYIYDRYATSNPASGVTTKAAEIIHPDTTQVMNGSGDIFWLTPTGSSVIVDLVASPGQSGTSINGTNTTQNIHDWYVALSASPDSIGSKDKFGAFFSVEYL